MEKYKSASLKEVWPFFARGCVLGVRYVAICDRQEHLAAQFDQLYAIFVCGEQ